MIKKILQFFSPKKTKQTSENLLTNLSFPAAYKSCTEVIKNKPDAVWFEVLCNPASAHLPAQFRQLLPQLPATEIQLKYTGFTDRQTLSGAFAYYKRCKAICAEHGLNYTAFDKMLDFGCGWGRINRFFLKDFEPQQIHGVDVDKDVLQLSRDLNIQCQLSQTPPLPDGSLPANTYDLITAFSVFSHLSEDAHWAWIQEFKRILKPGGILIVTTRGRDFIEQCAKVREQPQIPPHLMGLARSFTDTKTALQQYDKGDFCYSAVGGGDMRDGSYYGEACIPKAYIEKNWKPLFSKVAFYDYKEHKGYHQNTLVAIK
ncbi:MAG: class I SAM-dependent methyltransferase [Sphingobacteriales bacterium]|nr:class I SAM-dependent methyltransferase [Sphingobacteriales bacterium]